PAHRVDPFELDVPGDPSSAAFALAAGVLCGAAAVTDVCLNPGRTGFYEMLARMGAEMDTLVGPPQAGEPVGTVSVRRSELSGITVTSQDVPSAVDELTLLAVLATQAQGTTEVTGAQELRVKESDRIAAIAAGLRRMGATVQERPDGFVVSGPVQLSGAVVDSWEDHRIAMALAVAGLVANGETVIEGFEAASVSWPGFEEVLRTMGADVEVR
ncbi:MAG TPA: 3-phosphoshikimate 1-carboxyvinyltransferase, partial [Actinomycetota bacterium]|nr:3-phosphoshikimate 1-carboxyvinyltransferase [Actinomycetota bacterium]